MPIPGPGPKNDGQKRRRNEGTHEWIEVADRPYRGKVPVTLPRTRMIMLAFGPKSFPLETMTKNWWKSIRSMPHCALWTESDWQFALATAIVADDAFRGKSGAQAELRQREKIMGTTMDARRALRIRYVDPDAQKGPGSGTSSTSSKATAAKKDQLAERRARRERVSSAS